MKRFLLAVLFMALAGTSLAAEQARPQEPVGYRQDDFRAPTPATLKGGTVLDTKRAIEIWTQKSAVFVDALARPPKPADLPKKAVWREPPRLDIPGSIWLPDTGYGELAAPTLRYFEAGLARAAQGDKEKPLVFYCQRDCWMSWNAAKRALAIGYSNVSWYPDGVDGWSEAGQKLEQRAPEPRD